MILMSATLVTAGAAVLVRQPLSVLRQLTWHASYGVVVGRWSA